MFKLESYITPILLDYVSKYVKDIRPEDFQLSLWEGEVSLHNLDMRLDVLQEELNLPVEFLSGHIHDLSIRVPWTKITSEPITITINTIEFVLKLKDPRDEGAGSSANSSPQRTNDAKKKRKSPARPDDSTTQAEASSSWLVSKIINNISLQCHNIILKYVEEEIVVSMNVQLLSFGSANEKWASAMIDVHPVKVLMRKLVKISDLTICLDKRNSAGQIDVCQEPILYRSSLELRILRKYNANTVATSSITRIGVYTNLLDMNISSLQIPMCMRLVNLAMALKEGKIANTAVPETTEELGEEEQEAPANQSYLSWVWNMLPSFAFEPEFEEEPTNVAPCHTIDIGFYAEQLSFTLKTAELVIDTHMGATKRIRYSPIVRLTIGGMYFEMVSAAARNWTSLKAGVTNIVVEPLGIYKMEAGKLVETNEVQNQRPFIDKSLFDDQCLIADKGWGVTSYDEYTARITDDYLMYRSPVLAFDLIQYKAVPKSLAKDEPTTSDVEFQASDERNHVQYRFLTAGVTFRFTQTLEQVKHLICEYIDSYDYPAYYTEKLDGGGIHASTGGTKLPPPLMEDYDSLMRHIPQITYKFSLQKLTLEVYAKTEPDPAAVTTTAGPKAQTRRYAPFKLSSIKPPNFVISLASIEGVSSRPLQPDKLVHTTCQLPEKPQQLLDACYEHYELQLRDFSCSLTNNAEKRSSRLLHIPSLSFKYGKLIQPQHWKEEAVALRKLKMKCESICLDFTRRELSSAVYLMQCACSFQPILLRRLIRQEAPDLTIDDNTKLQNCLSKFQLRWQSLAKQSNSVCTLHSWESHVVCKRPTDVKKQQLFGTTATRRTATGENWLQAELVLPFEVASKEKDAKTAVGIWLAPFSMRIDSNIREFLRCRKFDELEKETSIERELQTQLLNLSNVPSNASLQSQTAVGFSTVQATQSQVTTHSTPAPLLVRRTSRNSLPTRKVSHPEETIHVSSERDEKLDKDTTASSSPKATDSKATPKWLTLINSYIFCIEVEQGVIHIAENLEQAKELTKIWLPKISLKPSSFDSLKPATLRLLLAASLASKAKDNISWTLVLGDFGVTTEYGGSTETLLETVQTTVTIALMHRLEKFKAININAGDTNEEQAGSSPPAMQTDNKAGGSGLQSASVRMPATSQIIRPISPSEADSAPASAASVTVGGRSDSLTDLGPNELQGTQTAFDGGKTVGGKQHMRKQRKTNRHTFTFNLHADTTPIHVLFSSRKVRTLESHLNILLKVIQSTIPITQPMSCANAATERVEIITATEESMALKEFMDLETNSESSKFSDERKDAQLLISLFCQWTITRIILEVEANPLNYSSSKVIVELEDLLSTIDKREDYTKCTSKVGNFNVTYYEENTKGDWESHDCLTARLLGETTNLPFLNVIYTSVELKQFFKRIGAKRKGDLSRSLHEIIITMQALEIIIDLGRISQFVAAISGFFEKCNRPSDDINESMEPERNQSNGSGDKQATFKPMAAAELPMIHLDSKGFTLYLPLVKGRDCCSVAIFRIENIRITPNLENPLPRKPLRADVFSKAAQLGMLGTPGAMVEDRQYELTLKNISAATGSWRQLSTHMREQRDNFFRTNPAVEWNNQNRKPELQITEIFNNFCFVAIYAPCIVYQNVLICGEVTEFNCATDFVASFNMYQLNMLSCLIVHLQRIMCFLQGTTRKRRKRASLKSLVSSKSSTSSTLPRCSGFITTTNLRDARNSSFFTSIDEDTTTELNVPLTDSGFQSCHSQLIGVTNLRAKERFGSISTISSLPPTIAPARRHIPSTISLVAGVFLFKFYNIQTHTHADESSSTTTTTEKTNEHIEDCIKSRTPLFSITLSQPSFMFTQNVYDAVMQLSLYDLYIYLASAQMGPSTISTFNQLVLDTRPGETNAAGIMPPLFSLRTHRTKMELKECDIDIAKPLALHLSEAKVKLLCEHLLLINATLLEDACFDVRPKRTIIRGSKIKLMRQQCFDADRLHFHCHRVVIHFENKHDDYDCKLVAADTKFNIKFLNRPEKATAKASIGAIHLLVDQKVILHPLNARLSLVFVSEPWYDLPLITAILKFNMIQLDVSINSVIHLRQAYEGYLRLAANLQQQWIHFLRNRPVEIEDEASFLNKQLLPLKCPSSCGLSTSSSKCSLQREEFYQDDLRAGAFQFVEMFTDSFLPMPYQIQIIKKNFGIICWRYPQPRRMHRIHVYPVPMAIPNPLQIRCRMEYFSEAHEAFLHYCDFWLSETVSKQIQLPERQICANIWRVVILQSLISVNGACFEDFEEEEAQKSIASIKIDDVLNNTERKESDFILHPKVLVGCMRIDTVFESACVPKVQFLINCNFLLIKLLNQPHQSGVLPALLKKFNLRQTTQINQAFLIMVFQNINMHAALLSRDSYVIEHSLNCSIKCLDHGFLNLLPLLEETAVQCAISVSESKVTNQRTINFNLVLDRLRINFGPSVIHSLLSSKMHWDEYLQMDNRRRHALLPKFIIVNRTYTYLTFGQTGTTERIQLQVRDACLYSFRSDYNNQELTFFTTDFETEMTEVSQPVPISAKFSGEVQLQTVRIGKKCLIIKSRKLSPLQIYIMIKGQIELMSMVPHAFRLEFRRERANGQDKKSVEYLIEERERACFYYSVNQSSNLSMRLKFANNADAPPKARSGDIPLKSNKNLPWLVKVPSSPDNFVSFWVRIVREDISELTTDNFKPQKVLITIWPIFEICSMLTTHINAEEAMTASPLSLLPEGKCEVLDVPATHLTEHSIRFLFMQPIDENSKEEFTLTLKMLDWKEFFWYDEQLWHVEGALTELAKANTTKWPCNDEEELRVRRAISNTESPTILYNCLPSRDFSCTLRLEVSPWGYFINATSLSICLRSCVGKQYSVVQSNEITMMFALEKCFTLEVGNITNWIASSPIYFEETASQAASGSQYYVLTAKAPIDIVILRDNQVLKFVLSMRIESNRRIFTLRSKFVVTNFTQRSLCVLPLAMDHKESAKRAQVENLDAKEQKRETQPVTNWDDCIGISLDVFYDLNAPRKEQRRNDTAYVFFCCVKSCADSEASIPIPLTLPFTRRCFSAQNGRESMALAVALIENDGIYYLNIFEDPSPALLINNQTDVRFVIAQTSASENSKVSNTTPEYIGSHFEWYQLLQAYSDCYYTPPEMYANFPDVDSTMCNLTLAVYKDKMAKKDIKWSKPIRTDKSWEKFLHIPSHGDVKVVICDKHRVIRISIFYIQQQKEFSVKDLRSRLLTTQPTTTSDIEASENSISSNASSPTVNKVKNSSPTGRCAHFLDTDRGITTANSMKTNYQLQIYAKEIILSLNTDDKQRDYIKSEVLSVYIDDFMLAYTNAEAEGRHMNLVLPNLQIDNQLHSTGRFDFPVIICAQALYQRTIALPQAHYLDCTYKQLRERSPMALIALKFYDDEFSISHIACSLSPVRAYIEDAYLNELLDALLECAPSNCVYTPKAKTKRIELDAGQTLLPRDIAAQAICIAEPLQLRSFRIEPLNVLLSVHTSLRLYIALDHSPLSFSSYERQQILTVPLRFGQSLGMHYLSGAIFGAGWVVGSLEILGSPSGLARSFTTGLRDFVAMPVQGLFRGPWGFIVGITQGSASLLRNVTAGTVNSLTKLAASVARNLDRLSLDREHIERTEALRRVRPNSMTEGLSQGLTGLGISILGALGGIAHHTLEARSPVEVVTGVGKGLVGAFTKPISGAAELVALTGQGMLQTVGFNALPQQRAASVAHNPTTEPSAYRIWKLLPSILATDQVLFYHEITLVVQKQLRCGYAFLTSAVFAILVAQVDKLEFAYPVNKVDITQDRDDKTLFYVRLIKDDVDELEDNISYTNERIMNFLRSSYSVRDSARMTMESFTELLQNTATEEQEQETAQRNRLDWAFYIDEHLGEHLMQYLKILRNEI